MMLGSHTDRSCQASSLLSSALLLRALLVLLLSLGMAGPVPTAAPVSAQDPDSLVLSLEATPESVAERDKAPGQCQVGSIPNPALTEGAIRLLMVGRKPDPIEGITMTAMRFQDPAAAAAVMTQWSRTLLAFDEYFAASTPLPPPPGTTTSATVRRVAIPAIGDETEAVVGIATLTGPAGEVRSALPYAALTFRDGAAGYFMVQTQIPVEDEGDPGTSAPAATEPEAVLERLAALARDIEGRSPGGMVAWSPARGHCVGGMFDVLPGPEDLEDAEVVFEQQWMPSPASP